MKNIAIIPARSGSKGVRDKNIKPLQGKPLFFYSIEAAVRSELFDEIMVSTDSREYADIAVGFGASVPFLRSRTNSEDQSSSMDVIREVLDSYARSGRFFDCVCLLQPTSPLRTAEDIRNAFEILTGRDADAVTSVCEAEHPPAWMMTLPDDGSLRDFRSRPGVTQRQSCETYYRLNGAVYIWRIVYEQERAELLHTKEYASIMPRERSIDIDTMDDFMYADYLMERRSFSDEVRAES